MKTFSPIAVAFVSSCLVFFHSNPAFAAVIDAGATPEDAASAPLDEPNDGTAVIDATSEEDASVPSRRRKLLAKKTGGGQDQVPPPAKGPCGRGTYDGFTVQQGDTCDAIRDECCGYDQLACGTPNPYPYPPGRPPNPIYYTCTTHRYPSPGNETNLIAGDECNYLWPPVKPWYGYPIEGGRGACCGSTTVWPLPPTITIKSGDTCENPFHYYFGNEFHLDCEKVVNDPAYPSDHQTCGDGYPYTKDSKLVVGDRCKVVCSF